MKRRNMPDNTEIGPSVHIRFCRATDLIFARKAKELAMAKATYIRIWTEKMMRDYGVIGFTDEN